MTDDIRALLKSWRDELTTQDNAITSDPVFLVERRVLDWCYDLAYTEDYGYRNFEDPEVEVTRESDPTRFAKLEEDCGQWEKVGYRERWEYVQTFLTRATAEDYRAREAHNLGVSRVYVGSGHRNPEWQRLRKLLSGELLDYLRAEVERAIAERDAEWRRIRGDV